MTTFSNEAVDRRITRIKFNLKQFFGIPNFVVGVVRNSLYFAIANNISLA